MKHKKIIWIVLACVCALALSGCAGLGGLNGLVGSGNLVTEEYDFTDFSEIELSHAFEATVTPGDAYAVTVTVDDNLVEHLVVEQNGARLSIGLEPNKLVARATMRAEITMPALTRLDASGATQTQLNGFSSDADFTGHASGASRIHGDLTAGDLDLEASGASTITLAGSAGNVRATASGASTIDLEEMSVQDAAVNASGASNVTVNLSGQLDADASGASNVFYLGQPTMGTIDTSGDSDVTAR